MATDSSADTHKYTVVEQGNITLGQAGVAFLKSTGTYTPPGMTIYGKWKTVALDSGSAFLYLGP